MNKYKFLLLVIALLSIGNGILFTMLIKEHHRNGGPKMVISKKLHFDKAQIKEYEAYIHEHRKVINKNELIMHALREDLFENLKYQQDTVKIDSLISVISKHQFIADKTNYMHFLEIKKICRPAQKEYFDELTTELANLFSRK